jgi:hypothetical protein
MPGEGKAGAAAAINPRKKKILAVASGGGHWVELIRLSPAFEGHVVVFATVEIIPQRSRFCALLHD